MFEKELIEYIKDNRSIRESSLKVYIGNVRKLNDNKPLTNLNFLRKTEQILNKIKDMKVPTQRNYLSSILVILTNQKKYKTTLEKYKERLRLLNDEYNKRIETHEKTEKEQNNWITLKELRKKVLLPYKREITERELNKKSSLKSKEFDLYQRFVVSALYLLLPAVRLDYAPMSVVSSRDDMDNKKNYLLNLSRNTKYFYLNDFKTSDKHGQIEIRVPKELNTILNGWLKFNDSGYLLLNKVNSPMSANILGKYITKSFLPSGKNITLNLLRKIWITENIDLDAIKRRKQLAQTMGHTVNMQETYIKE